MSADAKWFQKILAGAGQLVPAPEFAQDEFGVAAGLGDVAHRGRAAKFARVVDQEMAEAEHALRERGGDGHILNVA